MAGPAGQRRAFAVYRHRDRSLKYLY